MADQYVSKNSEGGWKVKGAGTKRVTSIQETQQEAIKAARKIAENEKSEVVIHGRDGKIRAKDSYGNDPFPPRG